MLRSDLEPPKLKPERFHYLKDVQWAEQTSCHTEEVTNDRTLKDEYSFSYPWLSGLLMISIGGIVCKHRYATF